jgi:hypothetical protein
VEKRRLVMSIVGFMVIAGIVGIVAGIVMAIKDLEEAATITMIFGGLGFPLIALIIWWCIGSPAPVKTQETLWQDTVKVSEGAYYVKGGGNHTKPPARLTLKLTVIRKYEGNPEDAPDQFVIRPLTKYEESADTLFYVAPESKRALIYLLKQGPGAAEKIIFLADSFPSRIRKTVYHLEFLSTEQISEIRREENKQLAALAQQEQEQQEALAQQERERQEQLERASRKRVFAVAEIDMGPSVSSEVARPFRGIITDALRKNAAAAQFTLVDTTQIDTISKQHQFELSDWSNPQKMAEIGRALNAEVLVTTEVSLINGLYTVFVKCIDVNTMEVVGTCKTIDALNEIIGKGSQRKSLGYAVEKMEIKN